MLVSYLLDTRHCLIVGSLCMIDNKGMEGVVSGIVKVTKAHKNTDDINDYYLKSEGTNEQQNHTA